MMSSAPTSTAIECRNVWKIFGTRAVEALAAIKSEGLNKDQVLDRYGCVVGVADVNFSVAEGEIFCIMGLSGSGKSTLVRHINRLIEPTAGEILIDGRDINKLGAKELRQVRAEKIGMVFQHTALLPHRTVRDNVALSLELRGVDKETRAKVAQEKLNLVSLAGWEDYMPSELSGGMQQRVGLARAMAANPRVLLMDEPFSALDPLIRRQLQDQFLELAAVMKKTTLFITHDLDEAIRIGNRIAIMKDGRMVQVGTPEEIITSPADDYVAKFVEGISRLHFVSAHAVMQSLDHYRTAHGEPPADCPTVPPETDLSQLINLAVSYDKPTIVAANGQVLGIVTTKDLLKGIQDR